MFGDKPQAFGKLTIDESKIYIVRRKADGRDYKIFHDGREELIAEQATEAKEK
jgi:hypothetical protein